MANVIRFLSFSPTKAMAGSIFLFLALTSSVWGQAATSTISGAVWDASGAAVPNVQLTITNIASGLQRRSSTNNEGYFTVPLLEPGSYALAALRDGFDPVEVRGIVLNVGDNHILQINLKVGSSTEKITIEANPVTINTTDAAVSTVVDRQFAENLPLNGRSFQSLLYLSPGVTANVASANNYLSQGQFVVNGQRGDANYWLVDGVSGNVGMSLPLPAAGFSGALGGLNVLGGTNALVSVDAMQEFRIETSTYAPEFGRVPGGQISIQTRSGTNQFHGTLFEYLRNGDLDAADWFANANGLVKPSEIQNDFGGVVGGPILPDRTFFFFSYEGLRLTLPQTFLGTVPDVASRQNAIPAMQPYLNVFPLPKLGAVDVSAGLAPYAATFSDRGSTDAYSLRVDHQLLADLNFFARYSHAPSKLTQRAANENTANSFAVTNSVTKTATFGGTWAKSASVVDDARFNYSVAGGGGHTGVDTFGGGTLFPSANLFAPGAGLTYQNSSLNITPAFGTNMREWNGSAGNAFQRQFNLVDNLAVQRGPHSLKFGVDYRRLSPSTYVPLEGIYPLFLNMEDLLAGRSYLTLVFQGPSLAFLLQNLGVFAQDTWRVSDRLNVTYGLRWDVDFAPSFRKGPGFPAVTGFSQTDLSNLALGPAGRSPYNTRYSNVAPRIGLAYQISQDPKWGLVFRSGFGVFYGLASTETFNQSINFGFYPFGSENVVTAYNGLPYVPFPTPQAVAALPPIEPPNIANQQTLFGVDPGLNVPYALEWNTALEQSLGRAQTVTLTYVGASDRRLLASESITNPNPNYASAYLVGNAGSSNYQALQFQFRRRLTGGLEALASYTFSHSIDTGSYGAYVNGGFASANVNRGPSDFDIRHLFSAAISYNVPALRGNSALRAITGGWSLHNVVQVRSGAPVDIVDANFTGLAVANSSVVVRPDLRPGQPLYLFGPKYPGGKAINPAAFVDPPKDPSTGLPLRQGNLGRNSLRAPGLTQWDFAVHREFPIREQVTVQFRAELFNLLNHPNFGPYNNQFQTGNVYFGQSTSMLNQFLSGNGNAGTGLQNPLYTAGGPRSAELALKLVF